MFRYFNISTLLLVFSLVFSQCNPEHSEPPNVVLIVVDDLGYADIGCAGLADDVKTPNIDRLAESGTRFTQAYATSPICSPSRGGLITGCYHERWGTYWYGGPGLHMDEFKTIAEILKANSYATGYVGKVHYGTHDSDTSHRSFPLNHGFDYYFGHTSARKHYLNHKTSIEENFQRTKTEYGRTGQSLKQQPLWENFNHVDTIAFTTKLFGKKACDFIINHKEESFFLQLSFNAVHNFTHQLPREYLESNNLKGYHDWDPAKEEYYEWYQAGRFPNNPEGRAHYLGQLSYMDQEIGSVIDCLERTGLSDNTLIVFVGDNGGSTPIYANNYPLRGSKYLLYEGGIRVPMIIVYPGKYPGKKVLSNTISAMDILPTICKVTGIQPPGNIDGFDLEPLLTGADMKFKHDTLCWETVHEKAVRAGKWKYHKASTDQHAVYEMVELELGEFLINLEEDPGETNDLKDEYPAVFEQLKAVHQRWKVSMPAH